MLQVNLPHSMWDYKISGVYKILFSDGTFYIGSSVHLRSRASCWESLILSGVTSDPKMLGTKIMNKVSEMLSAVFDIVELCSSKDVRDKEAFYLYENKDNPLMLSCWNESAWKPVLQYKLDGLFIKRHVSISAAAKYMGSPIGRIQDVLNGHRKQHKDMVFLYEKDYEDRRREIVKERNTGLEKKNGRDVVMCDLNGHEIKRYKKIAEASRDQKLNLSSVRHALSGKQKTAKGFIWKYADAV